MTTPVPSASRTWTVLPLTGDVDLASAPALRQQLSDLTEESPAFLVVDLSGLEFIDSTGLGVLVGGLKRVRAHDGWIDLVCTQGRILRIFRITGLNKVFSIHDSVADAVTAHTQAPPDDSKE